MSYRAGLSVAMEHIETIATYANHILTQSRIGALAIRAAVTGVAAFGVAAMTVQPATSNGQEPIPAATADEAPACGQNEVVQNVQVDIDGRTSWDCVSLSEVNSTPSTPEPKQPADTGGDKGSGNTSSTPSRPKPKYNPNSSTGKLKHFSLNMHDYRAPITSNGCGLIALTNAISYARQERTSVYKVWDQIDGQYTKGGSITMNQYMSKAAPNAARHFGLKARPISLNQAPKAIKHGSAVIMLAVGGPGNPITFASHYIEADEVKGSKLRIHDSNQTATRNLNNSYRSIAWLRRHGTMNRAWAISPKHSNFAPVMVGYNVRYTASSSNG